MVAAVGRFIASERGYAGLFGATAIAAAAVHSKIGERLYLLSGAAAFLVHTGLFNRAIALNKPSEHKKIKHWMVGSCLAAGAFATVQSVCCFMKFPKAMQALRARDMENCFGLLAQVSGAIGFGVPIAKQCYAHGLELIQQSTWKPMQEAMSDQGALPASFLDQCRFSLGLIHPEWVLKNIPHPFMSLRVQTLLYPFVSEDAKKQSFEALLQDFRTVAAHLNPGLFAIQKALILRQFKMLSPEQQLAYLPECVALLGDDILQQLDASAQQTFQQKQTELLSGTTALIEKCSKEFEDLKSQLNAPSSTSQDISRRLHDLKVCVSNRLQELERYFPVQEGDLATWVKGLRDLLKDMQGEFTQELMRQIAKISVGLNSQIDLEESIVNYYTSVCPDFALITRLSERLEVQNHKLDDELTKLGIDTIAKCQEKFKVQVELPNKPREPVNFTSCLRNEGLMYKLFDVYLEANGRKKPSPITRLAKKICIYGPHVATKATECLIVAAPLIVNPVMVALGVCLGSPIRSGLRVLRNHLYEDWMGVFAYHALVPNHWRVIHQHFTRVFTGTSHTLNARDLTKLLCMASYAATPSRLSMVALLTGIFWRNIRSIIRPSGPEPARRPRASEWPRS